VFKGEKVNVEPALRILKDKMQLSGNFEDLWRELVSRKYSPKTKEYKPDIWLFPGSKLGADKMKR
jgi:hypothetical protein